MVSARQSHSPLSVHPWQRSGASNSQTLTVAQLDSIVERVTELDQISLFLVASSQGLAAHRVYHHAPRGCLDPPPWTREPISPRGSFCFCVLAFLFFFFALAVLCCIPPSLLESSFSSSRCGISTTVHAGVCCGKLYGGDSLCYLLWLFSGSFVAQQSPGRDISPLGCHRPCYSTWIASVRVFARGTLSLRIVSRCVDVFFLCSWVKMTGFWGWDSRQGGLGWLGWNLCRVLSEEVSKH